MKFTTNMQYESVVEEYGGSWRAVTAGDADTTTIADTWPEALAAADKKYLTKLAGRLTTQEVR